jgi:hypothetical protein
MEYGFISIIDMYGNISTKDIRQNI